jgi:DNA-binding NarL/FixJ family response regulator
VTRIEQVLTDAERKILRYLLDGHENREIARRLKLSDKTVKNHIAHMLKKTKATSRLELAVRVYKARLNQLRRAA